MRVLPTASPEWLESRARLCRQHATEEPMSRRSSMPIACRIDAVRCGVIDSREVDAMARTTLLRPIPEEQQSKRGWALTIDGQTVARVQLLTLEHPHFGLLTYGRTEAGYDSW